MKKKQPLPPAAVIHQARLKLWVKIRLVVAAHRRDALWDYERSGVFEAERQLERQISIYTRTVRRTK